MNPLSHYTNDELERADRKIDEQKLERMDELMARALREKQELEAKGWTQADFAAALKLLLEGVKDA